jgi:hypothetical protein
LDPTPSSVSKPAGLWLVLGSALLAALALVVALRLTQPAMSNAAFGREHLTDTPERAADSFIDAYRAGDNERAAHFATPALAKKLLAEQPLPRADEEPEQHQAFVVQESHRKDDQSLRLQGVLLREGEDENEGRSVSLVLQKLDGRYLVEELTW